LGAVLTGLTFASGARAAIIGINSPVTSAASIVFDDTLSVAPPAGVTNGGPSVSPWNGPTLTMPITTDPNTLDFAKGSIGATYAGNNYAINFNSVTLDQLPPNTGTAHLIFTFDVEYQLNASGLPSQPTLYPNFQVNGTVQNSSGSFALVSGYINYSGVNTAGTYSVLETVNYNGLWNTPGNFSGTVAGVPVNGTTPVLVGNTTLTLSGQMTFQVDPASINASSVMTPEPTGLVLAAVGSLLILRRSRRTRTARAW
jgi:hypothetical protein